ncbi:hypothetical protein CANTEDRAFT_116685, partial [Yamadazyma tenuis ATCC 10573]
MQYATRTARWHGAVVVLRSVQTCGQLGWKIRNWDGIGYISDITVDDLCYRAGRRLL